jgi:hypothetical protein
VVKDVLDIRYRCSHDGLIRQADPDTFVATGTPTECTARSLGTATLSCP